MYVLYWKKRVVKALLSIILYQMFSHCYFFRSELLLLGLYEIFSEKPLFVFLLITLFFFIFVMCCCFLQPNPMQIPHIDAAALAWLALHQWDNLTGGKSSWDKGTYVSSILHNAVQSCLRAVLAQLIAQVCVALCDESSLESMQCILAPPIPPPRPNPPTLSCHLHLSSPPSPSSFSGPFITQHENHIIWFSLQLVWAIPPVPWIAVLLQSLWKFCDSYHCCSIDFTSTHPT